VHSSFQRSRSFRSCPPFDYSDLLAKDEVCDDNAEDEGDCGDKEVGGGHEGSDQGLLALEI
jgi:hypothetical protein